MEDLLNFDLPASAAAALQRRAASLVELRPLSGDARTVAGFDLSFPAPDRAIAAAVVVDLATLGTVDQAAVEHAVSFPYIPGLLSFREAPAVLAAFRALSVRPDVLMLDGQGLAHPRRFGIACHVGVALGLPSLGAAKSPLVGREAVPAMQRGDTAPMIHRGQVVGSAVRTRAGVKPVYVSAGHLIALEDAVDLVLRLSPRWRVPEPTRRAHALVTALRGSRLPAAE